MEEENESFATAEEYAVEHLRVSVSHVLTNIGFSAINEESLSILVDISRRFMSSLCGKTKFYAEHAGRTQITPSDLTLAFRRMQFSTVELYDYLDQVGTVKSAITEVPKFPVSLPKLQSILHPPPTREEIMNRPEHIPMHFPRMWTPKKNEDFLAVKAKKNPSSIPKFPDFTNSNAIELNLARPRTRSPKRSPTPDAFIDSVREKILPEKQYEPPIIIEAPAGLQNPKKKKRDYNKKVKIPKPKVKNIPKKIVEKSPQVPKKNKLSQSSVSIIKMDEGLKNVLKKSNSMKNFDTVPTPSKKRIYNSSLNSSSDSGSSNDSVSTSDAISINNGIVSPSPPVVERFCSGDATVTEIPIKLEKDVSDIEARHRRDQAEQAELQEKLQLQMLLENKSHTPQSREPSPSIRLEVSSTSADGLKIVISNPQRSSRPSGGRYSTNTTISPHSDFSDEVLRTPEEPYVNEVFLETPSPVYSYYDHLKPTNFTDAINTISMNADSYIEKVEKWTPEKKKHKKHKKEKKPKREKEKKSHKKTEKPEKINKKKEPEKPIETPSKSEHKIKLKIKLAEGQPSSTVCSFKEEGPPLPDPTVKLRIKLKEDKREEKNSVVAEIERKVPKLKIGLPKNIEPVAEPALSESVTKERPTRTSKVMPKTPEEPTKAEPSKDDAVVSTKPRKRKSSACAMPERKRAKDPMRKDKPKMKGPEMLTDNDDARTIESADEEIWICPACSVAWTEGATMIGCDNCDNWFHWHCVNINEAPDEQQEWYCHKCRNKKMKKTNPSKIRKK